MPFQGAVKGEAQRARFVRGEDRGLNEDQLIEKYGPANGKIAAQVVRRFEQQQGSNQDGFGVQLQRNEMPDERFNCLLYTSPSPRDRTRSRMPSSA